jgi:hypothetical protein
MGDDFETNEGRLRGQDFAARISASGYKHPDTENPYDQQSVSGTVDLSYVSGDIRWTTAASLTFDAEDLVASQRELAALHATLSGEAVIVSADDMLQLRVQLTDGKGVISGWLQEHGVARFEFGHIHTDQSERARSRRGHRGQWRLGVDAAGGRAPIVTPAWKSEPRQEIESASSSLPLLSDSKSCVSRVDRSVGEADRGTQCDSCHPGAAESAGGCL